MNRIISSSGLSLCIGAALLLASCNDQEVKVNSVNVNVTEALSPERSDSVRVNVNAEYPVDGLVDSVKNSICEIIVEATFGSDYSGLSVEDAANRWAGDFVAEYKKANLELKDIDLIEANEAFAAQSVAVANELGFDMDKVNVNGGAVALGHPIGASGCRILVTLLYEMKRRNAKYGLATLCVGGGMGVATIVEGM